MGRPLYAILASGLVCMLLAGCAGARLSDSERLSLYRAHAGESMQSFRFFGRLDGWTPLGDSAVAIWTRPGEAWLLELSGPCPDLPYSHSISVTSSMNRVHARFDKVQPLGSHAVTAVPCPIRGIRPLDVSAIRKAERDMREGGDVVDQPREEGSSGSGT